MTKKSLYTSILAFICVISIALFRNTLIEPTVALNVLQKNPVASKPLTRSATNLSIDFSKGLGLSHWFFIPVEGDEALAPEVYLKKWMTEAEVQSIATAGFKHVRLPIDPNFLQPDWKSGNFQVSDARLTYIDRAIELLGAQNIGTILDVHPIDPLKLQQQSKGLIYRQSPDYQRLELIWKVLSLRYSETQNIAYEILNEPQVENTELWRNISQQMVNLIRQTDTKHSIVVSPAGYGGVGELVQFQPILGEGLVYTFHFYTPMAFTHQGAKWLDDYSPLKEVPYPLDVKSLPKALSLGRSQLPLVTQKLWEEYKANSFNASTIKTEIKRATQWRDRYKVKLYCGEYGVHDVASKLDRVRWYQDVVSTLTQEGIGQSLWAYRGTFGLVPDGKSEMDSEFLTAIGLKRA